jgi:hypothetical protein
MAAQTRDMIAKREAAAVLPTLLSGSVNRLSPRFSQIEEICLEDQWHKSRSEIFP